MNLKTACMIALVLAVVSLPVSLLGLGLTFIPTLLDYFNWPSLLFPGVALSILLLNISGLIVFLSAYIRQLIPPATHARPMYILAGILILLSALISAVSGAQSITLLFRHMPGIRAGIYAMVLVTGLVSGICLGIFILMQNAAKAVLKTLGSITLAITVVLCCTTVVNTLINTPWQHPDWIMTAGSMLATSGYLIHQLAVILFLVMYLVIPNQTPGQTAADSTMEPAL